MAVRFDGLVGQHSSASTAAEARERRGAAFYDRGTFHRDGSRHGTAVTDRGEFELRLGQLAALALQLPLDGARTRLA